MKMTYDKEADCLYIQLKKGKSVKTKKVDAFTILDMDAKGSVIGIEIIDASRKIPQKSLSELSVKNIAIV